MLSKETFNHIVFTYDQETENQVLDFGSVRITDENSGRSFILDVDQSYRQGNEVVCHFESIESMVAGEVFNGETLFDLKEEDLQSKGLLITAYCGDGSSTLKPLFGMLSISTVQGAQELVVDIEG